MLKGIYLIIGEDDFNQESFNDNINACLNNNVNIFQLRFKNEAFFNDNEVKIIDFIKKIQANKKLCLINNFFWLVDKFNVDGLHVGQADISVIAARYLFPKKIIGVSCYKYSSLANDAYMGGADYVSFGAYNKSSTKTSASIIPKDAYKKINSFDLLPKALIGGITENNITNNEAKLFDMIAISKGLLQRNNIQKALKGLNSIMQPND